jgi:hypothetical protein
MSYVETLPVFISMKMLTEMNAKTMGQLLQTMQPTSKAEAIHMKFV